MPTPKHATQIANSYFMAHIGSTLRHATNDLAHEKLPSDIEQLLQRLEEAAQAEAYSGVRDRRCPGS